jgi:hypothetical protein
VTAPRLAGDGRLLVLSYYFPPMSVGPAFVLDSIFGELDLTNVTVFTGDPNRYVHSSITDTGPASRAEIRRFDIPEWWPAEDRRVEVLGRGVRVRFRAIGNVLVALRVALATVKELRAREDSALLVIYPKQHFLLAACLAAVVTRVPLLVYFMDVYVEGLAHGRRIARMIERFVVRRASVLFAMSEPHEQHLRAVVARTRSRAAVVELPHPYARVAEADGAELAGRPSIVFTGAIYDAQADAIRRLIEAMDAEPLADLDPRLHLLSQERPENVRALGIEPSGRVELRAATRSAARAAQRAADILFLPIAFDARDHVRRTASPSKMPEYLAAGPPILVHDVTGSPRSSTMPTPSSSPVRCGAFSRMMRVVQSSARTRARRCAGTRRQPSRNCCAAALRVSWRRRTADRQADTR